jgi:CRP/FNR family cyclic AMP-dependent transcriptional regulator
VSNKQPVTLLGTLPHTVREQLKARKYTVKHERGAQILREDDDSKDVFFINYGKVLVTSYTENGDRMSFTEIQAGEFFGELSAIDLEPRSANIVALEETSLTRIGHIKFRSLLRTHPGFAHFVMLQMTALIRRLHNKIYEFRALDVKHRIYAELLRLSEQGSIEDGRITVHNPPTHTEIAARINSHREAVSRTYRDLIRSGLIEKRSRQLIINQPDVLQQRIDQHLLKK